MVLKLLVRVWCNGVVCAWGPLLALCGTAATRRRRRRREDFTVDCGHVRSSWIHLDPAYAYFALLWARSTRSKHTFHFGVVLSLVRLLLGGPGLQGLGGVFWGPQSDVRSSADSADIFLSSSFHHHRGGGAVWVKVSKIPPFVCVPESLVLTGNRWRRRLAQGKTIDAVCSSGWG